MSSRVASDVLPASVWGHVGSYLGVDDSMALRLVVKMPALLDLMPIVTVGKTCRVWRAAATVELGDVSFHRDDENERLFGREEVQDVEMVGRWLIFVIDRKDSTAACRRHILATDGGDPDVLSFGTGGRALLFDVTSGEKIRTFEGRSSTSLSTVEGVAFSRDGQRLAIVRDFNVEIWDGPDFQKHRTFPVSDVPLKVAAFSPSGDKLAVAEYGRYLNDKTIVGDGRSAIHILDLTNGGIPRLVWLPSATKFPVFDINSIAWSRQQIAVGARAYRRIPRATTFGAALMINLNDDGGEFLCGRHKGAVTTVAFSVDGMRFAAADERCPGRIYDATSGTLQLVLPGSSGIWHSVATLLYFDQHMGARTIRFSDDGKIIATFMASGTSHLYDAVDGCPIATYTTSGRKSHHRFFPRWLDPPRRDLPLTRGRFVARLLPLWASLVMRFTFYFVVISFILHVLRLSTFEPFSWLLFGHHVAFFIF